MLEKKVARIALLYDFYGPLLTGKQKAFLEHYYEEDFSLGEIADKFKVSRQAVHDLLKRTEKNLDEYEAKLGLVAKYLAEQEKLAGVLAVLAQYRQQEDNQTLKRISTMLEEIVDLE